MGLPTIPQRVFPVCPKCDGKNFSSQVSTFKKVSVLIIFCDSCGSVLGIVNQDTKQK